MTGSDTSRQTPDFWSRRAARCAFSGSIVPGVTLELLPQHYWCMSPFDVSAVDAIENDTSYVNRVRLWCRHSSPQCAHKIAYPDQFDDMTIANSITAETIPFRRERDAIEYLVYLMGGDIGRGEAVTGGPIPLDSPPPAASVGALTLATEDTR